MKDIKYVYCVLADKGYSSRKNAQLIYDKGGFPYIKIKNNIKLNTKTKNYPAWKKMVKFQTEHPKKFNEIYRFRTKIESYFHSYKSNFDDNISCKNPKSILNEIYCKVIVYNIIRVLKIKLLLYGEYKYKDNLFTKECDLWFLDVDYNAICNL